MASGGSSRPVANPIESVVLCYEIRTPPSFGRLVGRDKMGRVGETGCVG